MTSETWKIHLQIAYPNCTYKAITPTGATISDIIPVSSKGIFEKLIKSATGIANCCVESLIALNVEIQKRKMEGDSVLLVASEGINVRQIGGLEIIKVRECIDSTGKVVASLTESTINKILRRIYQNNHHTKIVLLLENSWVNSLHERSLMHILQAAGYKNLAAAHQIDTLIPVLPFIGPIIDEDLLHAFFEVYLTQLSEISAHGISLEIQLT